MVIPLSPHQRAQFAAIRAESQRLLERQNVAVTTLIAGVADPAAMAAEGWSIALAEDEIVCTPPEDTPPPASPETVLPA